MTAAAVPQPVRDSHGIEWRFVAGRIQCRVAEHWKDTDALPFGFRITAERVALWQALIDKHLPTTSPAA